MSGSLDDLKAASDTWRHLDGQASAVRAELIPMIRAARKTHSLAEIAAVLGVSRQRVEQISKEETNK